MMNHTRKVAAAAASASGSQHYHQAQLLSRLSKLSIKSTTTRSSSSLLLSSSQYSSTNDDNNNTNVQCFKSISSMNRFSINNTAATSSSRLVVVLPRNTSRWFSTNDGGDGGDGDDGSSKKPGSISDDPFGLHYDDGDEIGKLGPKDGYPPKLKRDSATGKLLTEEEQNAEDGDGSGYIRLTEEERKLLRAKPKERERMLFKKIVDSWDNNNNKDGDANAMIDPKTGQSMTLSEFARKIRLTNLGLNIFGRSVQSTQQGEEDANEISNFSEPLSEQEFQSFQQYLQKQYNIHVTQDESGIPVNTKPSYSKYKNKKSGFIETGAGVGDDHDQENMDNPDLSLKWMTKRAQWEMNKTSFSNPEEEGGADTKSMGGNNYSQDDHPFGDLLPSELRPTRLVNRKRAKPIPVSLLSHNNLSLLKRYITPSGQIMSRIQTRLGARDQRRVSKLIKRARNLGLIPFQGQFIIENHGNIHEDDINDNKWWENELEKRGLVIDETTIKETEVKETMEKHKKFTDPNWIKKELERRGY